MEEMTDDERYQRGLEVFRQCENPGELEVLIQQLLCGSGPMPAPYLKAYNEVRNEMILDRFDRGLRLKEKA